MSVSRYRRTSRIKGGVQLGTSYINSTIYQNVENGNIETTPYVLKEGERLDHIAGKFLGNGDLWWILAATSGIGWMLQAVPGTRIRIPSNLNQIMAYVS
jgi:hypothetical protein